MTEVKDLISTIKDKCQTDILDSHAQCNDQTIVVGQAKAISVLGVLKHDPDLDFNVLMDLTAVDYLGRPNQPRFEVVYHLFSLNHNHRIRVKVLVSEGDCTLDSAVSLWPAANWYEREVWDMFGVQFKGHPNLKRLLMYEEFKGHPLRKDYPVNKRQPLIGPVI